MEPNDKQATSNTFWHVWFAILVGIFLSGVISGLAKQVRLTYTVWFLAGLLLILVMWTIRCFAAKRRYNLPIRDDGVFRVISTLVLATAALALYSYFVVDQSDEERNMREIKDLIYKEDKLRVMPSESGILDHFTADGLITVEGRPNADPPQPGGVWQGLTKNDATNGTLLDYYNNPDPDYKTSLHNKNIMDINFSADNRRAIVLTKNEVAKVNDSKWSPFYRQVWLFVKSSSHRSWRIHEFHGGLDGVESEKKFDSLSKHLNDPS